MTQLMAIRCSWLNFVQHFAAMIPSVMIAASLSHRLDALSVSGVQRSVIADQKNKSAKSWLTPSQK
ncbi:MAG: hypothetical protein EB060_06130 [Proteobacteria bacterium]|nr:hypothetical protein [Pseudomonadota bacterium]